MNKTRDQRISNTVTDDIIDYAKIDSKVRNTIKAIESKPHIRYIRYLLTKRYSPALIKQELFRLGLSAPHEPNLSAYYIYVLDPIVKKHGLSELYANYKNKLLRKNNTHSFSKDLLNYAIHLADDLDGQVKFCKFLKEIQVDQLWVQEIFRYHGSTDRIPVDETGERAIVVACVSKSVDKILVNPKRYLIDKLILENISDSRIAQYCKEELKVSINLYDIQLYKNIFFNIKTHAIEDKIKTLESEKKSLENLLKDLDVLEIYKTMDIGEKLAVRRQAEQRIGELEDNIKTLNMMYSEFAFKTAVTEQNNFEKMFADVVNRGYKRFVNLDAYKDRDVVDPMFKVTKLMASAHDKLESIKGTTGITSGDKHSQAVLMELYKQRTDDILEEEKGRANRELKEAGIEPLDENLIPEDIGGIEDLGVSFEIEVEEESKQ